MYANANLLLVASLDLISLKMRPDIGVWYGERYRIINKFENVDNIDLDEKCFQ